MSQIGIGPELKKKILAIEYSCLSKGHTTVSKDEQELIGREYAKIKNYYVMSQKHLPFVEVNNIRGDFSDDFFDCFEEIANWFSSRSKILSLVLIPSYNSILFVDKLITKGFMLSSYMCYWYKNLENETFSSYNKNNIIEVKDDLAEIFTETALKGFQIEPEDQLHKYFYNMFKMGCKLSNFRNFLYKIGERYVGAGSIAMDEEFGLLYNDSVVSGNQEQHIKQELINCRLDYAKSKGLKHMIVVTALDSADGRNIEKIGFQHAFTAEYYCPKEI